VNEKFFSLPEEKQQAIINAGYRVFSRNSYKNSPMSEIAEAAGISKSLLFHYFQNKMELYLFLWDKCAETTIEFMTRYDCYSQRELFESMERGMRAKLEIIRLYPDMGNFTIKAFYETDPTISAAVQESYHRYFNLKADRARLNFDPEHFIPGLDIPMMYREMYWASEGYLWEMTQRGSSRLPLQLGYEFPAAVKKFIDHLDVRHRIASGSLHIPVSGDEGANGGRQRCVFFHGRFHRRIRHGQTEFWHLQRILRC